MKRIKDLCRDLRKNQTEAEVVLWQALRNRKLHGRKFLRQHPIIVERLEGNTVFYVADFYCAEEKLVVEIDGPIHEFRKAYDKNRDEVMSTLGLSVIRFSNDTVLQDARKVLSEIQKCFSL